MTGFLKRWFIFIQERFNPVETLAVVVFYFLANALLAVKSISGVLSSVSAYLTGGLVILTVFFHLRIFDEIKDYQTDLMVNPQRPLARGLISVEEAKKTALGLILAEILLSGAAGIPALLAINMVIIYSLIMYREFFIGKWLRPHLTTYALLHTLISCLMSVFIFSAVTGLYLWQIPISYLIFVLVSWMIFNIFEFGRKTFSPGEEKSLVDSYSKSFGPWGAISLVLLMATVAVWAAFYLGSLFQLNIVFFFALGGLFGLLFISSLLYAICRNTRTAKIFRLLCSIFILFYNVIITIFVVNSGGIRWKI